MPPKRLKILIPNATSPRNIGDLAILTSLLNIIKDRYPKSLITVHSSDPYKHRLSVKSVKANLYWASVLGNTDPFFRISRIIHLGFLFMVYKYRLNFLRCNCELANLLNDYEQTDLIIFVGGGYFRSQKGLTQSLNLLMVSLFFQFARLFNKPKLVAPMSFGPFAHKWQEKYIASVLKHMDIVEVREDASLKLLQSYNPSTVRGYDQALIIPKVKSSGGKTTVIGFTVRKWLQADKQSDLENAFYLSLKKFAKLYHASILPIVQVDAPEFGDTDAAIAEDIASKLKQDGLKVLAIKKIKNLDDALKTYGKLDILLGMRMHSNILAAVEEVPFVAVAYEYKTTGIAKDLGLNQYSIQCELVSENKLFNLLKSVYIKRKILKKRIHLAIKKIDEIENKRWQSNFASYGI